MRPRDWFLVAFIATELALGAFYLARPRPVPPAPPVPDLALVDSYIAAHIRDRAAACKTPEQWVELGDVYTAYGYFPEAEACYRVAVEMKPNDPDWVHHWGFALERIGLLAEANARYERAIELKHPDPKGCWYYIGRNHLRLEKPDAALAAFQKAGDQPSARYEIARILERQGKTAQALAIVDQLAAQHPEAVQPPLLRHKIEILRDDPNAATTSFAATIAPGRLHTPFDADWKRLESVHDTLGLANELKSAMRLLDMGDAGSAAPVLRDVFKRNWDPLAADLLAEVEERAGNRPGAVRLLEEAIFRTGPSPHMLNRLGETHARGGQMDTAVAIWTRASRLGVGEDVKMAYRHLADHYAKTGNQQLARENNGRAFFSAAHEAFWKVRPDDTKVLLDKAVEADPNYAPTWFYRGEMYRLLKEPEAARKAYERCLAIDPNFGRAITALKLLKR